MSRLASASALLISVLWMIPLTASAQAAAYAWVQANRPSEMGEYEVLAPRSRNSEGAKNYVERLDVGLYVVRFGDLSWADGGTPQVTAVGADATHCRVMYMEERIDDKRFFVACVDTDGNAKDSWFAASFARYFPGSPTGPGRAYAWIENPRAWVGDDTRSIVAGPGTRSIVAEEFANPKFFNSNNAPIGFERVSVGNYKMRFFGQLSTTPNWRVTANSLFDPAYCKVMSILTPEMVSIGCFDSAGLPHDVGFYVAYDATSVSPWIVEAHGEVNTAGTTVSNVYNASGGTITVAHGTAAGFYVLRLNGVHSPTSLGTVHVTALSDGVNPSTYCKPTGWAGNPVAIGVMCFNAAGSLIDNPFSVSFMR